MANTRLHIVIIDEILRLKGLGRSQRFTSKHLGLSRNTVKKYWNGDVKATNPDEPNWVQKVDWLHLEKEVNKGITRRILFEETKELTSLPSYSSFCKYLQKKVSTTPPDITVRIERIPGDSVEVDYGGKGIQIIHPSTGEIINTQLFVGCMSYSKYIFAEFSHSQKLEDFISSHNNMFHFLGGVPRYVIVDNLKSGVTKADKFDPIINRTYHDLCIHYGLIVDPADVRKPRHKPNAEKAVDIIQRGFIDKFRNRTFTSLFEVNSELKTFLELVNNRLMETTGTTRSELFKKEIIHFKALPTNKYKLSHWKTAKVHPDCHIQLERNFYSVPSRYAGKEVTVKYNKDIIEIFSGRTSLAIHKTLKGNHHYSTNKSHYPEKKIVEMQICYQRAVKQAKIIGPDTEILIRKVFNQDRFPLKKLRKVQGILKLNIKYSNEALEHASGLALEFDKLSYYYIESCCKHYRPKVASSNTGAPIRDLNLICLQGGRSNE